MFIRFLKIKSYDIIYYNSLINKVDSCLVYVNSGINSKNIIVNVDNFKFVGILLKFGNNNIDLIATYRSLFLHERDFINDLNSLLT